MLKIFQLFNYLLSGEYKQIRIITNLKYSGLFNIVYIPNSYLGKNSFGKTDF